MFEFLTGKIESVNTGYVSIGVNGVGYRVMMGNPYTFEIGQQVTIYVEQIVRENEISLYGFQTRKNRLLFDKLLMVSGIGPKSALTITTNSDQDVFVQAIKQNDAAYLTQFPGVGKKTAQQIVLDLQNKLDDIEINNEEMTNAPFGSEINDAIDALIALEFNQKDVKRVEKELKLLPKSTTKEYIDAGLKLLVK